ncbi:MAG: HD domain-containing phosphohydrolase [Sedimentibacter sp.]
MATILVVDDEIMITKTVAMLLKLRTKNEVITYNNPIDALSYVNENKEIDVIISDFLMPDMNGIEFLMEMKKLCPKTESILLTGYADKENAIKSINEAGVYYYLEKPWNNEELVKIVMNALEKKDLSSSLDKKIIDLENRNSEINRLYEFISYEYSEEIEGIKSLMVSMANVIEARDVYTDGHTRRVAMIAKSLGKELGLKQKDIEILELVGVIHDIGKICISDNILNKPDKLNNEEFAIVMEHPQVGEKICRSLKNLGPALKPILHHHEKLDGSGYPQGLKGEEIDTVTRIITVSDIFDALYSDRPYRQKLEFNKVKTIMVEDAEKGLIDIKIVTTLFEMIKSSKIFI